jgi:hypothetical protein
MSILTIFAIVILLGFNLYIADMVNKMSEDVRVIRSRVAESEPEADAAPAAAAAPAPAPAPAAPAPAR